MDDEQEIDLDQITDENLLQSLLDQTDDPEDRKVIRDRIKELRAQKAAKKTQQQEKLTKLTNTREDMLQQKKKEAEAHKERTMAMYDNMAKSAPAGDQKRLDTSMLKPENKSPSPKPSQSPVTLTNLPKPFEPRLDYVEDAIKKRQREAEERKKRILAAFDVAAKSTPAGAPKDVDLEVGNQIDINEYEANKSQESGATFQMSGGVPVVKKVSSVPGTPVDNKNGPGFPEMDVMERSLRERQRECEERKQRILNQYKEISKQQAGPKLFAI